MGEKKIQKNGINKSKKKDKIDKKLEKKSIDKTDKLEKKAQNMSNRSQKSEKRGKDKSLKGLEENLNYTFKNRSLLLRALTHSSFSPENYERLEYLGDSVLDFLVGDYLFKNSNFDEGKLTIVRSHFVSEANLAKVFDSLNIEKYVILGRSYQGTISKATKGDIVEAIIAAIYLDSDIDCLRKFVENHLKLSTFESVVDDNYKSQLQELIQSSFKCKMQYVTEKVGDKFVSKFFMDEDEIASGEGNNKLEAEQCAAQNSLRKLFKSY